MTNNVQKTKKFTITPGSIFTTNSDGKVESFRTDKEFVIFLSEDEYNSFTKVLEYMAKQDEY